MKNSTLLKAENPQAYKATAEKGLMLAYPAKIRGQENRPDIVPYHVTIKMFDPQKDTSADAHGMARDMRFSGIDPKNTFISPEVLKDRFGNDTYAIKLSGPHHEQIVKARQKLANMGYPNHSENHPTHITVDKKTWDSVFASKPRTAEDAGIEFGAAQLRQGRNVLSAYKGSPQPEQIADRHKVLAASEKLTGEPLSKGLKEIASAAAIAGVIGLASPSKIADTSTADASHHSDYNSSKMLRTIASVESSGGKFANHRMLGGIHNGDSAYGKYALTPIVIKETIKMHPELKSKYSKAQTLEGQDLKHYMQDNPGLEDKIAEQHLSRLEHHFGKDPAKLGYAWLEGISGTYKAQKENKDIQNHWHVKKVKDAYGRQQ